MRSELLQPDFVSLARQRTAPRGSGERGQREHGFVKILNISFTLTRSIKEVLHKGHTHNGERS